MAAEEEEEEEEEEEWRWRRRSGQRMYAQLSSVVESENRRTDQTRSLCVSYKPQPPMKSSGASIVRMSRFSSAGLRSQQAQRSNSSSLLLPQFQC